MAVSKRGKGKLGTTAAQLLEMHIQHELEALTGDQLLADVNREVAALFELSARTHLNAVASVDTVMATIRRNVIEMDIAAGIPEIAGEMAEKLYQSPVHRDTQLGQIIPRKLVAEFVDELLLLKNHRQRFINRMLEHPIYMDLVSKILYQGIVNYIYQDNLISKNIPGVVPIMKFGRDLFSKAAPGLDAAMEKNLKAYIGRNLGSLVKLSEGFLTQALTDEELRETAMELWTSVQERSLGDIQQGMGEVELHEFITLGYEFWLQFRQTSYFEHCCRLVVENLFLKYGDQPLKLLLDDVGVSESMVTVEIATWLPQILTALKSNGYLEALLRRRLTPFYASASVSQLLDQI